MDALGGMLKRITGITKVRPYTSYYFLFDEHTVMAVY